MAQSHPSFIKIVDVFDLCTHKTRTFTVRLAEMTTTKVEVLVGCDSVATESSRRFCNFAATEPSTISYVNIRPLDVATIKTDIIQHANKHVTFGNNFSIGPSDWGWALTWLTAYNTLLYYCYNWH